MTETTEAQAKKVTKFVTTRPMIQLASDEAAGRELLLQVSRDRVNAFITVIPTTPEFSVDISDVDSMLLENGLKTTGEHYEAVVAFCDELAAMEGDQKKKIGRKDFIVSRGKAPKHGTDGSLDWVIEDPSDDSPHFVEDPSGRIDFRETNLVKSVQEGQELVKVNEPTKGESGTDCFGKTLPARNGNKAKFVKGKGVVVSDDDPVLFLSELEGNVQFRNGVLTVDPVFIVSGDVDMNVGNIDYPTGSVIVMKDVKDGFHVRARDAISVEGMVSHATLVAEHGNIEVKGGIFASGEGEDIYLEAEGDIIAKFFNNAKIYARGNVISQSQIINCQVNAIGHVLVPDGKVIGGECVALAGIDVAEAGTESGTKTSLILDARVFRNSEIIELDKTLEADAEQVESIESRIGPIIADKEKLAKLTPPQRENLKQLLGEMNEKKKSVERARAKRKELMQVFVKNRGDEIIIRKKLHAGVFVRIDDYIHSFSQEVVGPIKLVPNLRNKSIQIVAGVAEEE